MTMLNSTIFDCLIYKGYGDRVANRVHEPDSKFLLDLGLKDITLALDAAHKAQSPMPFASVLRDRFLAAQAKGYGNMDWSAIGMVVSENSGVDCKVSDRKE